MEKKDLKKTEFYKKSPEECLSSLESNENGLSHDEVKKRLDKYGENQLEEKKERGFLEILISQIKNPVVYLLTAAAVVAFIFGDNAEGIAILVVILINTIIGFWMEFQAQKSMDALKKMDKIEAKVTRDGKQEDVDATQLVPGDIIELEAGMMVPADARILKEQELGVDESPLTGESFPVEKQAEAIEEDLEVADRRNMIYKGTAISTGTGKALVTGTGMDTEIGNISALVSEAGDEQIPLDKKLGGLTKRLIWLTLGMAALFFLFGWISGKEMYILFQTAIAWTIAAIPEGLPVVASIALAKGMLRLAKHQVIVKKLSAVETLGETTVIFTDKTGTLTENKLSVHHVILPDNDFKVQFKEGKTNIEGLENAGKNKSFQEFINISAYCNDADLGSEEEDDGPDGDPLEIALLQFLQAHDADTMKELRSREKVAEDPFDSETKLMGTVYKEDGKYYVAGKGAAEAILSRCDKILKNGEVNDISEEDKKKWQEKNDQLSNEGLRVVAYAYKIIDELPEDKEDATKAFMHSLVFTGLVGFLDPPKTEVTGAIEKCKSAGIKVVMVTGDHPGTAKNIGKQVKLIEDDDAGVMTGKELRDDGKEKIISTRVFSRVDPKQKLDIIDHFQDHGEIVGMTGDGVNDAPALKKADIGIAMGKRGTQVAQEVADMVLKDDSFPSIVRAIEEGRIIFGNIRKFIMYQLSYHLGEILVIATISFTLFKLPLLPLQLLFLNLLSDVFPALALGVGRGNPHVMELPPKDPEEPILTRGNWFLMAFYGVVFTIAVAGAYIFGRFVWELPDEINNNIAFFSLAFAQLLHVFNMRERDEHILFNQVTRNKYVWYALGICLAALFAAYFIPGMKEILKFQDMEPRVWVLIVIAAFIPLIIIQIAKIIMPDKKKKQNKT